MLSILSRCQAGEWALAASDVTEVELSKCQNLQKAEKVRILYSVAKVENRLVVTDSVRKRAAFFMEEGIKLFDSLHLALAETYRQDAVLTTDDSFLHSASKLDLKISIANSVAWYLEILKNA